MIPIALRGTLIILFLLITTFPRITRGEPPECVVLLHGLARTEKSLSKLERYLQKAGYAVINLGYPSRKATIQALSIEAIPRALKQCSRRNAPKIHFVTHSMGGILVRYYLSRHRIQNLGRVVMLSPPNNGSEVVDRFKDTPLFKPIFRWINGPAGEQLGTGHSGVPKSLKDPDFEVGIITGDRSINPILSLLIPGRDDGKVSVENAKLAGMKDFLVVHRPHPIIMNDKQVLQQVAAFLKKGTFDKGVPDESGPQNRIGTQSPTDARRDHIWRVLR